MAERNTGDIGFEKQIWDAACVLRGNIDASEYKSVMLGLIFLKYISDRFEAKYQELVEEGDGFEEDIDEYLAENIFCAGECTLACHCSHSAYARDRRSNRHSDNWIDSLTLQHFSGYIYAAKHRCSLYYILLRLMLIVHFLPFFKAKITYLKFLL